MCFVLEIFFNFSKIDFAMLQALGIPERQKIPSIPEIDWSKYSFSSSYSSTLTTGTILTETHGLRGKKVSLPESRLLYSCGRLISRLFNLYANSGPVSIGLLHRYCRQTVQLYSLFKNSITTQL